MPGPAYQDWANYIVPGADAIVGATVAATNSYNGPLGDCSAWHHAVLVFNNNDTLLSLVVQVSWFYFNVTGTGQPFDQIVVGPGQTATHSIPVRGRQVSVTYQSLGGVPTRGAAYTLLGMSARASKYDTRTSIEWLVDDTTAYIAGGTKTIAVPVWYEGPVQIAIFSNNDTPAWVEFRALSALDSLYHDFAIVQARSWPNSIPHLVYFPPRPIVAFIDNSGGAQTVAVHATPAPTDGGG
jgi:hypothetical protein